MTTPAPGGPTYLAAPYDPEKLRHLAALVRGEHAIEAAANEAFAAWLPTVLANFEANGTGNLGATESSWDEALEGILTAVLALWASRYAAAGGMRPDTDGASFSDAVRARLSRVRSTVLKKLNDAVATALKNGATPEELHDLVRSNVLDPSLWGDDAHRIGRTEGPSAYNGGAFVGLMQQAPDSRPAKQWLSVRDLHVRPTHRLADGQTVPLATKFAVGGYLADYPGDPTLPAHEAIGCRCVLTFPGDRAVIAATGDPQMTAPETPNPETTTDVTTQTDAETILAAADADMDLPDGWIGPIAALDLPTGDRRYLATPKTGVRTRDFPITFTLRHVGEGDDTPIGRVDRVWVQRSKCGEYDELWGTGPFDLGGEDGREAARRLAAGMVNTVSIDSDQFTSFEAFMSCDGEFVEPEEAVDPENGLREGYQAITVMADWRLAGLAMVSIPAYNEARIQPIWGYAFDGEISRPAEPVLRLEPTQEPEEAIPDYSGSSMVALRVQNPHDFTYGWSGGLTEDELHVTLAYLGDAADLSPDARSAGANAAANAALYLRTEGAITMKVAGYGTLGDKGAGVLFLNGKAAELARRGANEVLGDFGWEAFPEQHEPFLAHMTLAYGVDPADFAGFAKDMVGRELSVRAVSFDFGQDRTEYELEPALVAAVTGKLSYPIFAERKAKWDGHKARQRVAEWASSDGSGNAEKINWSKFSTAFLYRGKPNSGMAASKTPNVEDFRGGFVDIIDGKPYIVANAIIGLAGGHGIQAMDVPQPDKKAMFGKLKTLYSKAREVFPDFPDYPFDDEGQTKLLESEGFIKVSDALFEAGRASGLVTEVGVREEDGVVLYDLERGTALVAAAGGQTFQAEFFEDPQLTEPTPLTVTEDGRVYGHVGLFDSCYMAMGNKNGVCQRPPRGNDFSRFHVHGARLEDGSILPVGAITFGEGHTAHGSLRASQRAYADIATTAAKVRAGEDRFGVWVSGQVVSAFADKAYDLLLSPLSGHWEPDLDNGGRLTMIAAHVVVTPGFHVPRLVASFDVDSGEMTSLIVTERLDPESLVAAATIQRDVALQRINAHRRARALERLGLITKESG